MYRESLTETTKNTVQVESLPGDFPTEIGIRSSLSMTNPSTDDASTLPKLICIEDDPGVLASVERLLRKDFQVLCGHTSEDAAQLIERHPDAAIVLTDLRLPGGKGGLEVLWLAQNKIPDAVRAVISGTVDISDMMAAINTSLVHRFVLKPWDNEYFRLQMREALSSHSILREKRQLEILSITDPVTSLKNHRYFQDRLRIEIERAARHARPLSLAMLDLDHFKKVNDDLGHPVGDLLLRAVAFRFLDQVRVIDTVARYGGEEFAVLMPDTTFADAIKVADRLRAAVGSQLFVFPKCPSISITVSIGVATCPDQAPFHPQELIHKADQALYQAKGQGRNQTVGAS